MDLLVAFRIVTGCTSVLGAVILAVVGNGGVWMSGPHCLSWWLCGFQFFALCFWVWVELKGAVNSSRVAILGLFASGTVLAVILADFLMFGLKKPVQSAIAVSIQVSNAFFICGLGYKPRSTRRTGYRHRLLGSDTESSDDDYFRALQGNNSSDVSDDSEPDDQICGCIKLHVLVAVGGIFLGVAGGIVSLVGWSLQCRHHDDECCFGSSGVWITAVYFFLLLLTSVSRLSISFLRSWILVLLSLCLVPISLLGKLVNETRWTILTTQGVDGMALGVIFKGPAEGLSLTFIGYFLQLIGLSTVMVSIVFPAGRWRGREELSKTYALLGGIALMGLLFGTGVNTTQMQCTDSVDGEVCESAGDDIFWLDLVLELSVMAFGIILLFFKPSANVRILIITLPLLVLYGYTHTPHFQDNRQAIKTQDLVASIVVGVSIHTLVILWGGGDG